MHSVPDCGMSGSGLLDHTSNKVLDPTLTNRLVVHVANKAPVVQLAISEQVNPCVREATVIGVRREGGNMNESVKGMNESVIGVSGKNVTGVNGEVVSVKGMYESVKGVNESVICVSGENMIGVNVACECEGDE